VERLPEEFAAQIQTLLDEANVLRMDVQRNAAKRLAGNCGDRSDPVLARLSLKNQLTN